MNQKSAARIRKHVKMKNPGLLLILSEEYGQEVYNENPKQIYKKAKKLYYKKKYLQDEALKLGEQVVKEELAKEAANDGNNDTSRS